MGNMHVEKESPKTENHHKHLHQFRINVREDCHHKNIVGNEPGALLAQKACGGSQMFRIGQVKGCLFTCPSGLWNLEITQKAIEETIELVSRESFEHLIHEGQWKMVLSGSLIQLSIVDAHSPPCDEAPNEHYGLKDDLWTTGQTGAWNVLVLPLNSMLLGRVPEVEAVLEVTNLESMLGNLPLIHLESEELELDRRELDKQEVEQPEVDRFDLDEPGVGKLELD
ncbi:hypothetical protein Tco_0174077 [Tanacetum coccineum]